MELALGVKILEDESESLNVLKSESLSDIHEYNNRLELPNINNTTKTFRDDVFILHKSNDIK